MKWVVLYHQDFEPEFDRLPQEVQDEFYAILQLLQDIGPQLGRPYVDTLKGSTYPNMKELRLTVLNQPWRFAFAFDPDRKAIVLVSGSKSGKSQQLFYKQLIRMADKRFAKHLRSTSNA